jgi:hypothetical protein
MAEFNRYWAEDALGEPYVPQDYRWMTTSRRTGLILGGVTCALTTGALLGAAVYHLVDPVPRVSISSYEAEVRAPQPAPPPAAPIPTTLATTNTTTVPAPPRTAQVVASAPQRLVPQRPEPPATKAATPKPQLANAAPVPAPAAAQIAAPDRSKVPPAASDRQPSVKLADAAPAPKPDGDTRTGLSKAAESKPADIASGEKLGIREILPDGIVMLNGRRVKNGSTLPNGEVLMGTDVSKGMAETDRRVLVLTP